MSSATIAAARDRSDVAPARPALALADTLMGAAWIAVCATGPEFIWRGARLVRAHLEASELLTAVPLGLLLAFFVEPLLERLRHAIAGHHPDRGRGHGTTPSPPVAARPAPGRGAFFHAITGLAFACCAVFVHDVMKAVVSLHGGNHPEAGAGPAPAIALTLGWALVPFAVALAWRASHRLPVCAALCVLAVLAPVLAGRLFDWSRADIVDTLIPCTAILLAGLLRLRAGIPWPDAALRSVAQVAAVWLLVALLAVLVLNASGLKRFAPYSPGGFWMDVRFYAGWLAGLWLVPTASATGGAAEQPGAQAR